MDKVKVQISNRQKDVKVPSGIRLLIRRCCTAVLDFEKFQQLLAFDNSCSPACNQCIARWICAGGCLHRNRTMNEACNKILCNFMREFTIKGLLQKLDFQYRREYGKTLKELLHIAEETE